MNSYKVFSLLAKSKVIAFLLSAAIVVSAYALFPSQRSVIFLCIVLFVVISALAALIVLPSIRRRVSADPTASTAWKLAVKDKTLWMAASSERRNLYLFYAGFEIFSMIFAGIGITCVFLFAIGRVS